MNVEVTKDIVKILEGSDLPNENEYKITTCYFTFDEFTESFQVKRAIFTISSTNEMYETEITNNECDIPVEVLKHEFETIKLGVYGFNIGEEEELEQRFSPSYDTFVVPSGSYQEGALSPEIITPSQYDIYSQALQEGLGEVNAALENVNEELDNVIAIGTDTQNKGTYAQEQGDYAKGVGDQLLLDKESGIFDGKDGKDGKDGTNGVDGVGLQYNWDNTSLGIKREDETDYTYTDLKGRDGINGRDGVDGENGKDATINGVNTLTIVEGSNITIAQDGDIMTISSSGGGGGGGTSNYNDLQNKPSINSTPLIGNKTSADLGLQPAGNYLTSETDPIFSASASANITSTDITNWNNKSDFSGSYNDLTDKPTIPDVSNFITKDVNNLTNYTLKTATGSLIDLNIDTTDYVVTLRLKDVDGNVISTDTIDLPLESVVVSGRYDNTTKKVILTLENGSEVDFSVADLVAGLQTEITINNKLASDLVDDTNSGNKFTNTSEKQVWNNKYDKPSGGIPKSDLSSSVQASLELADSSIQSHQDISGKEDKSNKVTSLSSSSTDTEYPSAKCVYDIVGDIGTTLDTIQREVI